MQHRANGGDLLHLRLPRVRRIPAHPRRRRFAIEPTAGEDCFRTFHFRINDVVLDPHVQGCRVMHGALAHHAVAVSREIFFVVVSLTRHCYCHCSLASGCCVFL
ncbi:unnamed protein product [Urochloa humidicola]